MNEQNPYKPELPKVAPAAPPVYHQITVTPATNPLAKGCAILGVGVISIWMLPIFLIAGLFIMGFAGTTAGFLGVPVVLIMALAAVIAIINSGKQKITHHVPAPLIPAAPKPLSAHDKLANLFDSLTPSAREKHKMLNAKIERLKKMSKHLEDLESQAQLVPGLDKLQWLHLKTLLARDHVAVLTPPGLKEELATKVETLRQTLLDPGLTETARRSKTSTLEMHEERLRSVENRACRIVEMDSDLERIEAQVDLSLERAALQSSGQSASLQLDLAERMVDTSDLFGSSLPLVHDLDAHFQNAGHTRASE
jgi:hypothetical protein